MPLDQEIYSDRLIVLDFALPSVVDRQKACAYFLIRNLPSGVTWLSVGPYFAARKEISTTISHIFTAAPEKLRLEAFGGRNQAAI